VSDYDGLLHTSCQQQVMNFCVGILRIALHIQADVWHGLHAYFHASRRMADIFKPSYISDFTEKMPDSRK